MALQNCDYLLIRLDTEHVAMFRFLLESYENMAMFTVLERQPALLKIIFAPESRQNILALLQEIGKSIPLKVEPYPFPAAIRIYQPE